MRRRREIADVRPENFASRPYTPSLDKDTDMITVKLFCADCGNSIDAHRIGCEDTEITVERCTCGDLALNRRGIIDRAIDLANTQKGNVDPAMFIRYCEAIEKYLTRREGG